MVTKMFLTPCNLQAMTTALLFVVFVALGVEAKNTHYIHWNKANPMFRLDNTDHIIDVNVGNLPWEYDQVNIICPVSKTNVAYPERHVIYSVSKEEFDSCRITNPKPKVVAVCSKPHQLLYFTITFRSFTPTPGGLEFHPGQDYYFISTSSREDLHRRVGGGCATHNMKMVFKVHDNSNIKDININSPRGEMRQPAADITNSVDYYRRRRPSTTTTTSTTPKPMVNFNSYRGSPTFYYHPRDLITDNRLKSYKKGRDSYPRRHSESWQNEALRYTSSAASLTSFASFITSIILLTNLY